MKQVSAALKALIESGRFVQTQGLPGQFVPFDLYTIRLTGGIVLLYTTADFPIAAPTPAIFTARALASAAATFAGSITDTTLTIAGGVTGAIAVDQVLGGPGVDPLTTIVSGSGASWQVSISQTVAEGAMSAWGNVWQPGMSWQPAPIDMKETKATAHWKVGLDSDTWQVKFAPRPAGPLGPGDLIGSQPWLAAAAAGALDNADCTVSRAYFASLPAWPMPAGGAVPAGTMIMCRGYLGEVDLTTTSAVLTINDYKEILQKQMPRNYYQPSCRNTFGDNRCGVDLALYTNTGAAAGSSTPAKIIAAGAVTTPGGSATYALGMLTFTSGKNAGFLRMVTSWDGSVTFGLAAPFNFAVAAGDKFSVSAGCPRTMAACTSFSNLANFRGNPFVPVPETSLG